MASALPNVRLTLESGHHRKPSASPLSARTGLLHRSNSTSACPFMRSSHETKACHCPWQGWQGLSDGPQQSRRHPLVSWPLASWARR